MEPAVPFDWHRIFIGNEPPLFLLEIVFRVLFIYLFALVAVRYMGKRGSSNPSPLETVVIIALGSATGDAMFYPQVPVTYACVVIVVIVGASRVIAEAQVHWRALNTFMDGLPLLIVRDGEILDASLHAARLRHDEFLGLLRLEGIRNVGEVQLAFLERSGNVSFIRYDDPSSRGGESTRPSHVRSMDEVAPDALADEIASAFDRLRTSEKQAPPPPGSS